MQSIPSAKRKRVAMRVPSTPTTQERERIANVHSRSSLYHTLQENEEVFSMMIYDILPQGEENAMPAVEIEKRLGLTARERRTESAKELNSGLLVLYSSRHPGGYFRPSDGEKGRAEIERFYRQERSRARSTLRKLKAVRRVLNQCEGQTTIDPPGEEQC